MSGQLDRESVAELSSTATDALRAGRDVVLDLSAVTDIDGATVAA